MLFPDYLSYRFQGKTWCTCFHNTISFDFNSNWTRRKATFTGLPSRERGELDYLINLPLVLNMHGDKIEGVVQNRVSEYFRQDQRFKP